MRVPFCVKDITDIERFHNTETLVTEYYGKDKGNPPDSLFSSLSLYFLFASADRTQHSSVSVSKLALSRSRAQNGNKTPQWPNAIDQVPLFTVFNLITKGSAGQEWTYASTELDPKLSQARLIWRLWKGMRMYLQNLLILQSWWGLQSMGNFEFRFLIILQINRDWWRCSK
jgi:hypothetical protein